MQPMLLSAPLKHYLWGGTRLIQEFGKKTDAPTIAESWELSCHPDGESVIASGEAAGQTLSAFLHEHPEAAGNSADAFPVLVKLIDAHENLSVQVHPDDAYAARVEHASGKTEMWYVIDCEPGAELIYGFRETLSKDAFREAIENGTLMELVQHVSVQPGDVFFIPAGTLHAIGKGILIAEIQQNSNCTYRVYDYGRTGADGKPRELHIAKALDVTRRMPAPPRQVSKILMQGNCTVQVLADCPYFSVTKVTLKQESFSLPECTVFQHILVLEGTGSLTGDGSELPLSKGSSIFLPAHCGAQKLLGSCTILLTKPAATPAESLTS